MLLLSCCTLLGVATAFGSLPVGPSSATSMDPGCPAVLGQALHEPWIGDWTLNVGQSSYDPGPAPWASLKVRIETWGTDGIKITSRGLPSAARLEQIPAPRSPTSMGPIASQPVVWGYQAQFDGREYRCKGSAGCQTVVVRRVDGRSFELVHKTGGVATTKAIWVISEDGRTMTITTIGATFAGRPVNNKTVYDRR